MAIIEQSRAYETLIRHNADGSIGAHHVRIAEIIRDGAVISATLLPPTALDVAAESDGSLSAIIGTAALAALADAAAVRSQLDERDAALARAMADLHAAQLVINELRDKLASKDV